MSMKKFKDKKKRLRRHRQIKPKISVPKIFIYNKLKENSIGPHRGNVPFPSLGDKLKMISCSRMESIRFLASDWKLLFGNPESS